MWSGLQLIAGSAFAFAGRHCTVVPPACLHTVHSLQMAKSCYHHPLILETVIMFRIRTFDGKEEEQNCVFLLQGGVLLLNGHFDLKQASLS